jgi:antibiotic biosynthesis monooxygenase (ABM) superfamily enzyme
LFLIPVGQGAPVVVRSVVTQTYTAPGHEDAFTTWQKETNKIIAGFQRFVRRTVIPPSPPIQVDWAILQYF